MTKNIQKIIISIILAVFVSIIIFVGLILLVNAPKYYPDTVLEVGEKITVFFERIILPIKIVWLSRLPADKEMLMPVYGVKTDKVTDTWLSPRPDERSHEGQDIFASRGTPVFSATKGYVTRISVGELGGNFVNIAGAGGLRYYYAHLDRFADGLRVGQSVTTDTVIGFVGNTGNANNTPPHLHFGVYFQRNALNPMPYLTDRSQ